MLHVPGLDGRALRFATSVPERGATGAALGYAGGGSLAVLPAAVAGAYEAIGHDIYDGAQVRREIVELRAAIEPGDSGGPLILEDGTIGGLVFAESRTDPDGRLRAEPGRDRDPRVAGDRADGRRRRGPVHRLRP